MNLASRTYDEKRAFICMRVDTQAHIFTDNTEKPIEAYCLNLSGGGMLVESDTVFDIGQTMRIALISPQSQNTMMDVKTTVRRSQRLNNNSSEDSDGCILGLEITEVLN